MSAELAELNSALQVADKGEPKLMLLLGSSQGPLITNGRNGNEM